MIKTEDGSYTLYSKEYDECYHSVKEGALTESIMKYVEPAFKTTNQHLRILDICFGLGYNTLACVWYFKQQNDVKSIEIFSPELDEDLVKSLLNFEYPKELEELKYILEELIKYKKYEENGVKIELYIGDALEYIPTLENIDAVFQDAFSPTKNPLLWSEEYFINIYDILSNNGVLFSYSIARLVRDNLEEAKFKVEKFKMRNNRHILMANKP